MQASLYSPVPEANGYPQYITRFAVNYAVSMLFRNMPKNVVMTSFRLRLSAGFLQ
jgi:hypothetical protein